MTTQEQMAREIEAKAIELGYESCGIIGIEDLAGYEARLAQRIEKTPENAQKYGELYRFLRLEQTHPWVKSIVVCVRRYGKYAVPESAEGKIGRYYLTDWRRDENSPDHRDSVAFEAYLTSLGLKLASERGSGITALRWAAVQAGLGLMRRNNFFYTASGSWVYIEAWLIDRDLRLTHPAPQLKPCPPDCRLCQDACPTGSLSAPYTMSRATCVTCLTVWSGDDIQTNPLSPKTGSWLHGCDACQEACPHNRGKWEALSPFPGLDTLCENISPAQILDTDYETLDKTLGPKFWYITPDRLWKWKLNALNALRNAWDESARPAVERALEDPEVQVRSAAAWLLSLHD